MKSKPTIFLCSFFVIVLLLVSGCVNKTPEFCTAIKYHFLDENFSTYMENGVCITAAGNITHPRSIAVQCRSIFETVNWIVVYNESEQENITDFGTILPKSCEVLQ